MLGREAVRRTGRSTRFLGFGASELDYRTLSFECHNCTNRCEIVQVSVGKQVAARWGGRCDRWEVTGGEMKIAAVPQVAPGPAAGDAQTLN